MQRDRNCKSALLVFENMPLHAVRKALFGGNDHKNEVKFHLI